MRDALICLSLAWHALAIVVLTIALTITAWAIGHLSLDLTLASLVLLARHRPHRAHPVIAFLAGAGIATWVTGHRPKATPASASAATGPQVPA